VGLVPIAGATAATSSRLDVPVLTPASFADPPASVRPKYRWWMPLAYTDDQELRDELHQIKDVGGGGAEVSAFSVPGTGNKANPFLATYGWGTPLWAHKVEVMAEAARDDGLTLDATVGPSWPSIVPSVSNINDPRAMQQLVYGRELDPGGTTRTGPLPAPTTTPPAGATTTLVGVVAGRICELPSCVPGPPTSAIPLDPSSVVDLTSQVDSGGNLAWTAPLDGGVWALIDFYDTADGQSLSGFTTTTPNYVVDHLSVAGAHAVTDYWDQNVLTPASQQAISDSGGGTFEDSLELSSNMHWTWDFLQQFQQRRGYSLVKLLPALAGIGRQGTTPPAFDFPNGIGARIRTDYRQTWSDLYIDNRLDTLRAWDHDHGFLERAQPYASTYPQDPIDTAEAASHLDIPEGESLWFLVNPVEDTKVVAVGAHMTGGPLVSVECCALVEEAYETTSSENLASIYKELAGGVTQVVWHGLAYNDAPGAVWPGWDAFPFPLNFSEEWGPRNPTWAQYRNVNDHLARLQLTLRQGKPRFDVAVYWQRFEVGVTAVPTFTSDSAMAQAGYTYEYLSPAFFRDPSAVFQNARLFPSQSAYKALVLDDQATMHLDVAQKILALAQAGLPVVVIGPSTPSQTPGYYDAENQDAALQAVIAQLLALPNVVQVQAEAQVPAALQGLGVRPDAEYAQTSGVLNVHRAATGSDYYFFYNQTPLAADVTVSLTGSGIPYGLDSWTGRIAPIATFTTSPGRVTLPVHLAAGDVTVVAVATTNLDGGPTPVVHATSSTAESVLYRNGDLLVRSTQAGTYSTTLSDGRTVNTELGDVPAPTTLSSWHLHVDSWEPGASATQTNHVPHDLDVNADPGGMLPAWPTISELQDVSGTGTYTAAVTVGAGWTGGHGAYLDLGTVLDTFDVTVNGHALPAADLNDPSLIDVGRYLGTGTNTIVVDMATTLNNRMRTAQMTSYAYRPRQNYGLIGPVKLIPYGQAVIPASPTAVVITRLTASRTRRGIAVSWHTGNESEIVGFDLFCNGVKLNRALIAAKRSGRTHGATYRFIDSNVPRRRRAVYRLETVGLDGLRRRFGPVTAREASNQ
jgi:hypothetical protein